jgi:hypothetical protein
MRVTRNFPRLTGLQVNQDRSLPYKLVDAIFQIFTKHYDLADQVAALRPAVVSTSAAVVIEAKWAEMNLYPAASYAIGSQFIVSDRDGITYVCRTVDAAHAWKYSHGTYRVAQSAIAALVAELGANDENLKIDVTDYAHKLRWTGTAFTWADGDDQSDYVELRRSAPNPTTGWKLVDGNGDDGQPIGAAHPIKVLQANGSTVDVTALADLTAGVFLKAGGPFTGAVVAAVAPGITGVTGSTSAGTPNGTVVVGAAAGSVVAGTGATAAAPVGHGHGASFTGVLLPGHDHDPGTLATDLSGGDPVANMEFLPWFRK